MKSLFFKQISDLLVSEAKRQGASAADSDRRLADISRLTPEEALKQAGGGTGLSTERAAELLQEHGPNEISRGEQQSVLRILAGRFRNPLVIQLLVIGIVSLIMGDIKAAVVVSGMVFLSVILAHIHESRSTAAVEKLRAMVQSSVAVLRDGKEQEVPMSDIVPGDIVMLDAGALIPADVRIITVKDFYVSQSVLTGESMPLEKVAAACDAAGKGVLGLNNVCFLGSNVMSGTARGLVVNTGANTYLGRISESLAVAQPQTSFDKGIAGFTWLMLRFMIVMVGLVFLIVGMTKGNWGEAVLFGLAVAVGLTPEMLPMIVTVNLSKGAMTMSRKKVIVKRLNSIQNLGAIDILCTDKTGTLTQDRVILEKYVDVTNRESEDVLRYSYMNSYYQTGLRNLLDRSILAHADLDVDRTCSKVDEIPFDFVRKRMSVIIDDKDCNVLICKGAVEDVYKACDRYQVDDEIYPLIDVLLADLMDEYRSLSADGYRILAVAYSEFPRDKQTFSAADETNLILLGYLAFLDPPKDSATQALKLMKDAGIRVKVLTGDNALVTKKICHDVGINVENVITGDQLIGLSQDKLGEIADTSDIFAALSPQQKEDIVQALRARDHVVGYLGDGINDAPSLRASDVGISVDTAVDVAKESADIVLLEKSLLVLEEGIMEGRRVFSNIIKYIRMGASSNFGNMFSVVGGSYFLPFLPMTPVQILTNNLLYDISQTGIPTDKVDSELIVHPRKWNIQGIKKFMLFIGPISSIFDYATFFLMLYFFNCKAFSAVGATAATKSYSESLFHTGWFVESLLTQTMIVHIIRTRKIPFLQSAASGALFLTTLAAMFIAGWLPYSPAADLFGLVPLPISYWIWIAGFLLTYAVLTHIVTRWYHNKYGVS